jgi:hypothetical protein
MTIVLKTLLMNLMSSTNQILLNYKVDFLLANSASVDVPMGTYD